MEFTEILEVVSPHIGTLVGFSLAFVLISRLMREKRRPSNTFAWLLIILLVPYLGVPLYIVFGGRKIARLTKTKGQIDLKDLSPNATATPFGIISDDNKTTFLPTGTTAYESLLQEIRSAETSIEITTFILSHDSIGRQIVKELSKRAREGISVCLLLDAVGSFGKKTLYILELEKAGGHIARFMPLFPFFSFGHANLRNHRKIAIFDRKRAIIGGRNIGKDYMGPTANNKRWKDFGVLIEGPAIEQFNAIFRADWQFAAPKVPLPNIQTTAAKSKTPTGTSKSTIEIMASGPDTAGDPLYEKILLTIQEAKESVTIVTPYFIPDEVLQRSLIVKARTGKKVTILVPLKSNHRITDLARAYYLRELINAGAEVRVYLPGMNHGKILIADGKIAMTGSANVDFRSLFLNYEIGAFFYDAHDIQAFESWISTMMKDSDLYQNAINKKRSILRELGEDLSRLLTPVL